MSTREKTTREKYVLISREMLRLIAEGKVKLTNKVIRLGKWKLGRKLQHGC